jgi:basic membrane protein A
MIDKVFTASKLILVITLLGISACTESLNCSREDVFCAGLVTDTLGIHDYGLNHDTWEGLQQAKAADLVDRVAYIETVDPRDGEKNLAKFAQEGYDIIITVGMGLREETLRYADLYPDSVFIGIDQSDGESRKNLVSVVFPEDQAGFLAGALAAQLTETGVVGAACETSGLDSMWRYCEGFRNGAQYIDEDLRVLVKYRNSGSSELLFIDSEWGNDSAQEMIQQGADVIFAAGGATGQGALGAAAKAGVYAIGAEKDQRQVLTEASSAIVTSVYGRSSYQVQELIRKVHDGQQMNGNLPGVIGLAPYNPNIRIPDDLRKKMDKLLVDLVTGKISTNVPSSAQ